MIADLWNAYRGLRRNPSFAVLVVAMLALGIGVTAALFAVVDSALLRPLPGAEPERLVWLQEYSAHEESGGTPLRFADWQRAQSFSAMCGMYSDRAIFETDHGPVRLRILHTLGDPNKTLGISLKLGRGFTAAEDRGEGPPVALLSAQAWRRYFGTNSAVLNRVLRLGSTEYQVVGVLASESSRGVQFPENVDLWAPLSPEMAHISRQSGFLEEVARLGPGVSLVQAQAELNLMSGQLAKAYPATDKDRAAALVPLQEYVTKTARRPLLTLFAAAGALLLIACVNIAGLLIARGLARQREAAIRIAVGAGFWPLARLCFAESLLLAGAGCVLGIGVADLGIEVLRSALPPEIPNLAAVSLDWRVLICSLVIAAIAAILFGGVPALQFAADGQAGALKAGGWGTTSAKGKRLRASLVALEVAGSLVLLVAAALLANSFFRMRAQPNGFNATNVYSFRVPFGWDSDPALLNSFAAGALSRLTTSPGVVAAGVVDQVPLHGGSQSGAVLVQGLELEPGLALKKFSWRTASAGYFPAASVALKKGSLYRDWLGGKGSRDAVITEQMAELLFPHGGAVGHSIAEASTRAPQWFRIVGVVGGVRLNPTDFATESSVYVPWGATYWPEMNFVVKSNRNLEEFTRLVRNHVQPLTNVAMIEKIGTLESLTGETSSDERVRTILIGAFAGAALALAAIGLFGALSQEVARRRQDYGVRLALGAEPRDIGWMAVQSSLVMASVGVAMGVAGSVWTSQFLRSFLFGVEPTDFGMYGLAVTVLMSTALMAAVIPAMRAARIDPIEALRHE